MYWEFDLPMTARDGDDTPHLRDLPGELVEVMRGEWNRRTRFGKLLYPFWILDSVMQWIAFLLFMAFIVVVSWIAHGLNGGSGRNLAPEVYKNE